MNRNFFKKISFRLTVIFAAILVTSTFLTLFLSYLLFEKSLKARDHDLLNEKARQYAAHYAKGGIKALDELLTEEKQGEEESLLLVSVESSNAQNLYLHIPEKMQTLKRDSILSSLSKLGNDSRISSLTLKNAEGDRSDDDEYEGLSLPIGDERLEVMRSTSDREDLLERYLGIIIGASGLVLILGSFGGYVFSNQAMAPLRNLIQTMKRIYSGQLDARVKIRNSHDELDEIGILFNRMSDKMERLILNMQETLDYVAHDLKTPLTRLKARSELLLLKNATEAEYKATLADNIENTAQIVSLIDTLMDISEAQAGILKLDKIPVNSHRVITSVLDLYAILAEEKNILIRFDELAQFEFFADENRFKQVLSNLIDNAIKYSPKESEIIVTARAHGSLKEIVVKDQGIGISEENIPKIWDRLFRAEEARSAKGMGLGLSLVKSICKAHGWQIQVTSHIDAGSEFILTLR